MGDELLAIVPRVGELDRGDATAGVERLADRLLTAGVTVGETVGLRAPNGPDWLMGLLALLRAGARPLLLAHDSPAAETHRQLLVAGGRRLLDPVEATVATIGAAAAPARGAEPGDVLLTSSGSTGAPKIVVRSARSLADEGRRYLAAGYLTGADVLLLPLPMSHAYALGWVAAALLGDARVVPVPPQALDAARRAVTDGATVLATVPGLARALVRRLGRTTEVSSLRLVMAGAGYVDAALDERWRADVGVGLARNFGSTETGAVLAGPAGLPSGCVGAPMPGVLVDLHDDHGTPVSGPGDGEIVVRLETGVVHRMGDLARRDEHGNHQIIGRRATNAVRRGARWVSTLEVAEVVARAPGVADAHVLRGGGGGPDDEDLVAEYVPAGAAVTPEAVAAYVRANLAAYKVPNVFRPRRQLVRGTVDKVRLASPGVVTDALEQRRRAEVVFALAGLGVLPGLAAGRSAVALAAELGLDADALAALLAAAHQLGVVTTGEPGGPVDGAALQSVVLAVRDRWSASGLVAAVRGDSPETAAAEGPEWDWMLTLAERVHGPAVRVLRAGEAVADGTFDVCLVLDAVHGPAGDLLVLRDLLAPGGVLVVADRFTDAGGVRDAVAPLAWLAAGGRSWWRLADLQAGLESVGLAVRDVTAGPGEGRVTVVAGRAEEPVSPAAGRADDEPAAPATGPAEAEPARADTGRAEA
jgi:acyl-CoA synthetase (AMP-forming)/AMP-acid ligase II